MSNFFKYVKFFKKWANVPRSPLIYQITRLVTLKQKIYKMLIVHLVINYDDGKKIFPYQNPFDEMISAQIKLV